MTQQVTTPIERMWLADRNYCEHTVMHDGVTYIIGHLGVCHPHACPAPEDEPHGTVRRVCHECGTFRRYLGPSYGDAAGAPIDFGAVVCSRQDAWVGARHAARLTGSRLAVVVETADQATARHSDTLSMARVALAVLATEVAPCPVCDALPAIAGVDTLPS